MFNGRGEVGYLKVRKAEGATNYSEKQRTYNTIRGAFGTICLMV